MKALLIGAGGMGQTWARNLTSNPECTLAGWVDVRPDAAKLAASSLGLPEVYCDTDMGRAAAAVTPDFVVDVTSPEAHHDVTVKALDLGLPVIGEKPMASNIEEARSMVEASKRNRKLYMVSQSRRYDAGMVALREGIRGLGSLGILNVDFYIGAHFGGFRDTMESPLLLDMAIHTFDQARYLSEADPVSVIAEEFNPTWSWYEGNASASASFEMSNGTRFNYRGSWCAEGLPTSWDGDWRAVGALGSATWSKNGEVQVATIRNVDGFTRPTDEKTIEQRAIDSGISGSLKEFLHSLATGKPPQTICTDNIKSLAMVFAAKQASKSGSRTPVEW